MLFHNYVGLSAHRTHFLHRTDLEGKEHVPIALVLHFENLSEVAVSKLLDNFEVFNLERTLVPFDEGADLGSCELRLGLGLLTLAGFLVLWPGGSLAIDATVAH